MSEKIRLPDIPEKIPQIDQFGIRFTLGAIKGIRAMMRRFNCETLDELEKRVLKIKEEIEKK
ncbi:MAG: hypothetical protein ABSG35_10735 [Syntrophobacteraceae bacterium]|jgi:hypothetical protein